MKKEATQRIEKAFREQVERDPKVKNAYLMVEAEKTELHLSIAEGSTGDVLAHPEQPNYMASVGKLFTAALTGILVEGGKLSFDDPITGYLDEDLLHNLHVYKGTNYTGEIKIKHLLNQTSGLYDHFWPLLEKLMADPAYTPTPREAIIWGKNNLKPHFPPGKGYKYTDTNYHLMGLIIERVTGEPFHEALDRYIFKPLKMEHSFMLHYSEPLKKSPYPVAEFYHKESKLNGLKGYAGIDYSGGGVVAPTTDLLKFMKALVAHHIVSKETLEIMKNDQARYGPGIMYGYGIWQFVTVPLLMPQRFNCWGVAGATGAFMFYHPEREAYLIGNFNHTDYSTKGVRFMLMKVIKHLF